MDPAPAISAAGPEQHRPRHLLRGLALGVLAALFAVSATPASAAIVPAREANAFVNSIGVDTHFSYSNTVYGSRFKELEAKLEELGVHHIREDLVPNRPDQYERINELASRGIKDTLIMGWPKNGVSGLNSLVSVVKNKLTAVDAVEGPNEYYLSGEPEWTTQLATYQRELYEAMKSEPALASIPVIGPSTIFWQNGELGNISQWLDYGNIHPYPGGYPAEEYLQRHMEFATRSSGSKPIIATETGYHNAMNWKGAFPPTSEQAIATYMPRLFLDYFQQGVVRTFCYELVDEWPDPNQEERESNFGLLKNNLSEKPSFIALRNLIGILQDPGPSFATGSLNYTVSGSQEKLHQVLLQKRDGSFYLALWRASSVWDPVSQQPLSPPTSPVTVSFGEPVGSVSEYLPTTSGEPVSSPSAYGSGVTVNVGPQVVLLKIAPGTSTSATNTQFPSSEQASEPGAEPQTSPGPATSEESSPTGRPVVHVRSREHRRRRITVWVRKGRGNGTKLTVGGRLRTPLGHPVPVKIQSWDHGWRTLKRSRASQSGNFKESVDLRTASHGAVSRLRAVAPAAAPSRTILVRG